MIKQLSITVFFRVTDFRVTEKQKWELDTVLRTLHGKLYFGSKYAVPIFLCFLNFHVWWFFCLLQFDYCLQKFLNEASIKCPRPENVGRQQGKAFVSFIFFCTFQKNHKSLVWQSIRNNHSALIIKKYSQYFSITKKIVI